MRKHLNEAPGSNESSGVREGMREGVSRGQIAVFIKFSGVDF